MYAFHITWNNRVSAQVLSLLHQSTIKVRSAMKKAVFGDQTVQPGGLLVTKTDHPKVVDFEKTITELVNIKTDFNYILTGFSSNSKDVGGDNFNLLKAPKIVLLSRKGVWSTEFGVVWYYLEETLGHPVSVIDADNLKRIKLYDYNTLILPDGYYDFSEEQQKQIVAWVNNGGKMIAMNSALSLFEGKEGYALSPFTSEEEKLSSEKQAEEETLKERFLDYQDTERRYISKSIPGAIIENLLNNTHPMSFGLGDKYFSLKTDDRHYSLLKKAINVAYVPKEYKSYGFVGNEIRKKLNNTVSFAVDKKENGAVIYMVDNPLFRGFWENGILLFSNALFLVN